MFEEPPERSVNGLRMVFRAIFDVNTEKGLDKHLCSVLFLF